MSHHITLTIDDQQVIGKITCNAVAGANCRLTCLEDCESFVIGDHEHELVDAGECMLLPFLDEDSASVWELFDGRTPTPARSGPIILAYVEEGVVWDYAPKDHGPTLFDLAAAITPITATAE